MRIWMRVEGLSMGNKEPADFLGMSLLAELAEDRQLVGFIVAISGVGEFRSVVARTFTCDAAAEIISDAATALASSGRLAVDSVVGRMVLVLGTF